MRCVQPASVQKKRKKNTFRVHLLSSGWQNGCKWPSVWQSTEYWENQISSAKTELAPAKFDAGGVGERMHDDQQKCCWDERLAWKHNRRRCVWGVFLPFIWDVLHPKQHQKRQMWVFLWETLKCLIFGEWPKKTKTIVQINLKNFKKIFHIFKGKYRQKFNSVKYIHSKLINGTKQFSPVQFFTQTGSKAFSQRRPGRSHRVTDLQHSGVLDERVATAERCPPRVSDPSHYTAKTRHLTKSCCLVSCANNLITHEIRKN